MKSLFRSPAVQGAMAVLLAAYLKACYRTLRWTVENAEAAERVWAGDRPVLVFFWHSRITLAPWSWPLKRAHDIRALVSLSRDGEFIADAMQRLGFPAIRGSAAKKTDPQKAKGGAAAFRDILRWLKGRRAFAVTPDGPRGPAEVFAEGPPMMSRMTGAEVLFIGAACEPCITLNSWDKGVIPLPFARAAIVWGEAPAAPADADAETLERLRQEWAERLSAATRRAEAVVGAAA